MISVAEAAERLGISRQRISRLCKDRRIPGARLVGGRTWMLPAPLTSVTPDADQVPDAAVASIQVVPLVLIWILSPEPSAPE